MNKSGTDDRKGVAVTRHVYWWQEGSSRDKVRLLMTGRKQAWDRTYTKHGTNSSTIKKRECQTLFELKQDTLNIHKYRKDSKQTCRWSPTHTGRTVPISEILSVSIFKVKFAVRCSRYCCTVVYIQDASPKRRQYRPIYTVLLPRNKIDITNKPLWNPESVNMI